MLPDLLVGEEHKALQAEAQELVRQGVPEPLALRGAGLLVVFQALDITEIALATQVDPLEVARVYVTLSDRYAVDADAEPDQCPAARATGGRRSPGRPCGTTSTRPWRR